MWYRYADTINGQNFNLHVLDNKITNRETRIYQNLILQNIMKIDAHRKNKKMDFAI